MLTIRNWPQANRLRTHGLRYALLLLSGCHRVTVDDDTRDRGSHPESRLFGEGWRAAVSGPLNGVTVQLVSGREGSANEC